PIPDHSAAASLRSASATRTRLALILVLAVFEDEERDRVAGLLPQRLGDQGRSGRPGEPVPGVGLDMGRDLVVITGVWQPKEAVAPPAGHKRKVGVALNVSDESSRAEHDRSRLIVHFDVSPRRGLAAYGERLRHSQNLVEIWDAIEE